MFKQQDFLLKVENTPNIQGALEIGKQKRFSGLITSIANERNKLEFLDKSVSEHQKCFTRSPLVLSANQWLHCIYPFIKITADLENSDEEIRRNYELKIIQEINFAVHLKHNGWQYIKSSCNPEVLGKFLYSQLSGENLRFVVEINLYSLQNYFNAYRGDLDEDEREEKNDTWTYWNRLHKAANYSEFIEVALVINSDLPNNDIEAYRWLGEPVLFITIPHSSFVTNTYNYPVLSKKQLEIVRLFLQYSKCHIVIEPKSLNDPSIENYMEYLQHQRNQVLQKVDEQEMDSLRLPLQPLYDNLDSSTYETFERDPAKYILYQQAIEKALIDLTVDDSNKTSILMLVGAGRGPLIRASINASINTNRKIKILAVEKNPNAIVTLSCLLRDLWPDKDIQLIAEDMRHIQLQENADIIISELLGSLGDNELSPECLDGVQHLLKPTGISIPCNSKSYIQPVMTKRNYGPIQKKPNQSSTENLEKCWLIYTTNIFHIDETKLLFTFVHPNNDNPIDNSRYKKIEFTSSIDCVLHGFSGYFSSQLYKDIQISIEPSTHTKGMISWYSAFFPLETPVEIRKDDKIVVEFWRKLDTAKVWYEWKLISPEESKVHNMNGDIHPILL